MKRITAILLVLLIAVMSASCALSAKKSPKDADPQTFTYEELTITLTSAFSKSDYEGYSVVYDSDEAAVFVLREAKDILDREILFDEYIDLVKQANENRGFTDLSDIEERDGLTCFDYRFTNTEQNTEYHFLTTLHDAENAFWLVQFVAPSDLYDEYYDVFLKWAKTITFA
jgi:hypothetical protein